MPTTFDDIKREELQTTLAARQEEYAAVQDQIRSTLSAIDQKKLERQAVAIENEIAAIEKKLSALEAASGGGIELAAPEIALSVEHRNSASPARGTPTPDSLNTLQQWIRSHLWLIYLLVALSAAVMLGFILRGCQANKSPAAPTSASGVGTVTPPAAPTVTPSPSVQVTAHSSPENTVWPTSKPVSTDSQPAQQTSVTASPASTHEASLPSTATAVLEVTPTPPTDAVTIVAPVVATPTPTPAVTPVPTVIPTPLLLFSRPLQKNLSVSGTPIPVAVKDFVVNFCAKADEGQKIEEIAEKHQVESSALQQANSIRDKDKWRALANELIVIPRQERDMVDDLTRLTVDLANASQVSAVTGECKVEALGTIWGSQPREETQSLRDVLLAKDKGHKRQDCPVCARSGSIMPQVIVNEPGRLIVLAREQWDYYYQLKTPGWHRYTWTTIVLYQFEGTESGKWELTYYQTKRARAPEGPVAEPALPNDCLY